MFANNKYTKIYWSLISNAQSKNRVKRRKTFHNYVYYELHHIIPRSIGGTEDKSNLVLLTAREHFICHYLLCKMTNVQSNEWNKLSRAFLMMFSSSSAQHRYFNSRLYDRARKNISIINSVHQTGSGNSQYNTTWVSNITEQKCIKICKTDLEKYLSLGYVHQRIINFNTYKEKPKISLRIKQKLDRIERKMLALIQEKEELLKGFEPPTS